MLTPAELRAKETTYRNMAVVVRLSRVRLIKQQIEDETYDEASALPVVGERVADELEDAG